MKWDTEPMIWFFYFPSQVTGIQVGAVYSRPLMLNSLLTELYTPLDWFCARHLWSFETELIDFPVSQMLTQSVY